MRRYIISLAAGICALGAVTFAIAQDASPTPSPEAAACASPAASPAAGAMPAETPAAASSPAASPEACGSAGITIEAVDIAFRETALTVPAGVPVTITLINEGLALHNFSIDSLGISVDLPPGETETVTATFQAGAYDFYCDIPGHLQAGMKGVITAQ